MIRGRPNIWKTFPQTRRTFYKFLRKMLRANETALLWKGWSQHIMSGSCTEITGCSVDRISFPTARRQERKSIRNSWRIPITNRWIMQQSIRSWVVYAKLYWWIYWWKIVPVKAVFIRTRLLLARLSEIILRWK